MDLESATWTCVCFCECVLFALFPVFVSRKAKGHGTLRDPERSDMPIEMEHFEVELTTMRDLGEHAGQVNITRSMRMAQHGFWKCNMCQPLAWIAVAHMCLWMSFFLCFYSKNSQLVTEPWETLRGVTNLLKLLTRRVCLHPRILECQRLSRCFFLELSFLGLGGLSGDA